jgi:hypothetical protein
MFDWLYRWLGYHVCEKFTAWESRYSLCERAPTIVESMNGIRKVRFTKRWQERKCLECGFIQLSSLRHGGPIRKE